MSLRIQLSCVFDRELLSILFRLFFNPLAPILTPSCDVIDLLTSVVGGLFLVFKLQGAVPFIFV